MRISFLCVLNYGAGCQAQKSKRVKDWEITNSSHFWLVWKSKDNYMFSIVVCLSLLYYSITHFQNKYRKMILSSSLQLRLFNWDSIIALWRSSTLQRVSIVCCWLSAMKSWHLCSLLREDNSWLRRDWGMHSILQIFHEWEYGFSLRCLKTRLLVPRYGVYSLIILCRGLGHHRTELIFVIQPCSKIPRLTPPRFKWV